MQKNLFFGEKTVAWENTLERNTELILCNSNVSKKKITFKIVVLLLALSIVDFNFIYVHQCWLKLLSGEQAELVKKRKMGENHTTHRRSCDRLAITLTGNHVESKSWAHVSGTREHLEECSIEPQARHIGYKRKKRSTKVV